MIRARISLVLLALSVLGCAQAPQLTGSGRYLQLSVGESVFMQMAAQDFEQCRSLYSLMIRDGLAAEASKNPSFHIACNHVSAADKLPAFLEATNVMTGETAEIRVISPMACEVLRDATIEQKQQNDPLQRFMNYGECMFVGE